MVRGGLREGILGRAVASGLIDLQVHDLRDFTTDRHKVVDDTPFGGGPGMVLKAEPLFRAVEHLRESRGTPDAVLLPSPQGRRFTQAMAEEYSRRQHLVLLCGRYEGVDERVSTALVTE
jgi:tRNA (guanine37-N1)-methyltransferase